jgi:hypothetical protein
MRSRAVPHASASTIAERRARFGTLACNIHPVSRDDRGGTARVAHHGSEYVFTFVKLFIASCTPSL